MAGKFLLTILFFLLVTLSCSNQLSGGSTDTEVGGKSIALGNIFTHDSSSTTSTVKFIPFDYKPGIDSDSMIIITTTDSWGNYEVELTEDDISYNLLVRNNSSSQTLFKKQVLHLNADTEDTLYMGSDTLISSGEISVTVPDSLATGSEKLAYIVGTDISSSIGSMGKANIKDIPAGALPEFVLLDQESNISESLQDEIIVKPDETTFVGYDMQLLFIYDDNSDQGKAELELIKKWKLKFRELTVLERDQISSFTLEDPDVIFIAGSVDSLIDEGSDITTTLYNSEIPLVVNSRELLTPLGLISNGQAGDVFENDLTIKIDHPINGSEAPLSTFLIFSTDKEERIGCGIAPTTSATVLLKGDGIPKLDYLFFIPPTSNLADGGKAPGYRLGLFEVDDVNTLSETSKGFYLRTVLWAAGLI